MRSLVLLLLSSLYMLGTVILPDGNFLYVSQISDLYHQYEAVNGKTDFFSFFDENFLEFEQKLGIEDDDDPFEEEEQQIPFKIITTNISPAYTSSATEIVIKPQMVFCESDSFYLEKDYTTEVFDIFHPPRCFFI